MEQYGQEPADSPPLNESPGSRKMWSNEEITSIIQAVRTRPFLYDKKHSDYKHHQKKEMAWDEIAASLQNKNLTARECKRKWNTLRIQKRRILNQQTKRGKNKHTVLWQFFDALDFLMPHMEWIMTKTENSDDVDFDDTSAHYETYDSSFTVKKLKTDPSIADESMPEAKQEVPDEEEEEEYESDDPFSDDQPQQTGDVNCPVEIRTVEEHVILQSVADSQQQQQHSVSDQLQQQHLGHQDERLIIPYHELHHHQQQQQQQLQQQAQLNISSDSVVSPAHSAPPTEIIRLIHPGQGATSVTTSDGQTVFMTPSSIVTPQQLINISRYTTATSLEATGGGVLDQQMQSVSSAVSSVAGSAANSNGHAGQLTARTAVAFSNPIASSSSSMSNQSLSGQPLLAQSLAPIVTAATTPTTPTLATSAAGSLATAAGGDGDCGKPEAVSSSAMSNGGAGGGSPGHMTPMRLINRPSSSSVLAQASAGAASGCGYSNSEPTSDLHSSLRFFLLDVEMQMRQMNAITQMEMKVEIQKILLGKMRVIDLPKSFSS